MTTVKFVCPVCGPQFIAPELVTVDPGDGFGNNTVSLACRGCSTPVEYRRVPDGLAIELVMAGADVVTDRITADEVAAFAAALDALPADADLLDVMQGETSR